MYSLRCFQLLPTEMQIDLLNKDAVALDLAYTARRTEAVLFAYNNFYVELIVEKFSDEILAMRSFKSGRKLQPFLNQVDISEITALLSCAR